MQKLVSSGLGEQIGIMFASEPDQHWNTPNTMPPDRMISMNERFSHASSHSPT